MIRMADTHKPIIRCQGLSKTYRMGDSVVQVLKGVDLSVRPGEFVAIEGRSGSGKSTLLHLIGGLDAPDSGVVDFEGVDIASLARVATPLTRKWNVEESSFRLLRLMHGPIAVIMLAYELARLSRITPGGRADRELAAIRNCRFGFVFQFYHLLPELNVLENTLLPTMTLYSSLAYRLRRSELRERAIDILSQVGLDHRLKHKPNQLSGGERQRVAIARALMNDPRIIFADEPTGNLDAETGRQIMSVLERLHRDKNQTIIMVTHDRTIARQADRVLVLKEGRLDRPPDVPPKPSIAAAVQ